MAALHEEYQASEAQIRQPPVHHPWAYEMQVLDRMATCYASAPSPERTSLLRKCLEEVDRRQSRDVRALAVHTTCPMMYWDDVNHHVGDERMAQLWLADADVRRAVNAAVSGSPDEWPLEWFAREYAAGLPFGRAAVIGCGTGALERDLLSKRIATHVAAIDVAPGAVAFAQSEAERSGLQSQVSYLVADAAAFLRDNEGAFDAVFFHGSLHHLEPVEEILRLTRKALRPGGLLYLDEYVGPSMRQWTWWRLVAANGAYYALVPRALRRPRLIRAPRNPEDASEMIDSASILPAVRRQFRVVSERGYGGNILGLVYPNLRHRSDAAFRRAVRRLICLDRRVAGVFGPHYAVVVARA